MQKLSNTASFEILFKLLLLTVIAKMCSLALLWFLPADGIEVQIQKNYQPAFEKYSFTGMLQEMSVQEEKQVSTSSSGSGVSITNMILKGLYGNGTKGMVIVAMKSDPKKSEVIAVGEEFGGYKLKLVNLDSALFSRGGSDYILEMQVSEKSVQLRAQSKVTQMPQVNIDVPIPVTKNQIELYAKNPNQIWKEISIIEVKEKNQIKGFKVTRIDPKSPFAMLGLQKNDLIIKANNVELKSYKDAIDIYQQIDKLQSIQIVFLRNNQEMEIVYEIN